MFAYWRLRGLFSGTWNAGALVRFHTAHKLILMAHSPVAYQAARAAGGARAGLSRTELVQRYTDAFMTALTVDRHAETAHERAAAHGGLFQGRAGSGVEGGAAGAIDDYRRGLVPLVVPLTLIRHHVRAHDVSTWPDSCTLSRIRRNSCCATTSERYPSGTSALFLAVSETLARVFIVIPPRPCMSMVMVPV